MWPVTKWYMYLVVKGFVLVFLHKHNMVHACYILLSSFQANKSIVTIFVNWKVSWKCSIMIFRNKVTLSLSYSETTRHLPETSLLFRGSAGIKYWMVLVKHYSVPNLSSQASTHRKSSLSRSRSTSTRVEINISFSEMILRVWCSIQMLLGGQFVCPF